MVNPALFMKYIVLYRIKFHRRAAIIIDGRLVEHAELPNVYWPNLQKRRDYVKSILDLKPLMVWRLIISLANSRVHAR